MAHQPAFAPVQNICEALHAFHVTGHDRNQVTSAYHYCACLPSEQTSQGLLTPAHGMRQCLLYSGTSSDAKLIGVEFLIEEADFVNLPAGEKPYWHSHQHEVESGLLCALAVRGVVGTVAGAAASVAPPAVHPGGGMPDVLERPYLQQIFKMYGKIFHFYDDPAKEAIPMGPPRLMMSTTQAHPSLVSPLHRLHHLVEERDRELGLSTDQKHSQRTEWLPGFRTQLDDVAEQKSDGQPRAPCGSDIADGADAWEKTGRIPKLVAEEVKVIFEDMA